MDDDKAGGSTGWSGRQALSMAVICLLLGVALGYLYRGSATPSVAPAASNGNAQLPAPGNGMPGAMEQMPTLDQMKQMADTKAEPLLAKLKTDPKNADLLVQVGKIYNATHQFKEAAGYYEKSLQVNPKDVATRTELASCLYYTGDVDGALAQLEQAVKDDPSSANSLFNLGLIRWKGKKDVNGAVAAWQQLLKSNPKLDGARKAQVQKLIAEASQQGTN
ncbi:MAG: tetratricopeptide repeat protein [Acidobacteriia bacterium]|nr:tetratricopeptide repeat protein [Terriglobia bacterium]